MFRLYRIYQITAPQPNMPTSTTVGSTHPFFAGVFGDVGSVGVSPGAGFVVESCPDGAVPFGVVASGVVSAVAPGEVSTVASGVVFTVASGADGIVGSGV